MMSLKKLFLYLRLAFSGVGQWGKLPYISRENIHLRLKPVLYAPIRLGVLILLLLFLGLAFTPTSYAATQTDIVGPAGSGAFGLVAVLNNGNIVVADPGYDAGAITNAGAVYLYNGATKALISTLTGSTVDESVGTSIVVLSSGNFVVRTSGWDNGAALNVGAVTWCSGVTGCPGTISTGNSLVGTITGDGIGSTGILALNNGHYIVRSNFWDNGATTNAGAVTWCNGWGGCTGAVSAANSLVGSRANDQVGDAGVRVLPNNQYVVQSQNWDNGALTDAGAVTWCQGITGCVGAVSVANSLVGSNANDTVGSNSITALSNGHFLVHTPGWDNGGAANAGALTWCNGTAGCSGTISAANSLVGSTTNDYVGQAGRVTGLSNGHYVVASLYWDNGAAADAGAVTWCNGSTGCTGIISSVNSLLGSTAGDQVGLDSVAPLSNGNYVVRSRNWDNGATVNAGAATWCSGTGGCVGTVSASNSLVGTTANDYVGAVKVLSNGHYVVFSSSWDSGAITNAGATTWCDGTVGCTGIISASNSLVGGTTDDYVGSDVTVLSNGNYIVLSHSWDQGGTPNVGAATWCDGLAGCTGSITPANSLVGTTASDYVGYSVVALANGHYVVGSPSWNNGATLVAGAVTWCNGSIGCTGIVSPANSLVGGNNFDNVGFNGITPLTNGHYVVRSSQWDNGTVYNAGAVTWCDGTVGCVGTVTAGNSLVGSTTSDGVGGNGVYLLTTGHFVVPAPFWDNGAAADAGAITWCNGVTGCTGAISSTNSLVGTTTNDQLGSLGIVILNNGNYVVPSRDWDNGLVVDVGAITYGAGYAGTTVGPITASNSVLGAAASGGSLLGYTYDPVNEQLIVSQRTSNLISLFRPTYTSMATGNWSQGQNWDYGAFTQSVDVRITGAHTITLDGSTNFNSLTIDLGSQFILAAGNQLSVETALTNNGSLTQHKLVGGTGNVAFLEIPNSAATAILYRGVEISGGNNLGVVAVTVRELNTGEYCTDTNNSSPPYARRCYTITPSNNLPATVRLYARTSDELNGIPEGNLAVFRFVGGWNPLTTPITGNDGGAYSYAQGDTPGFSAFILGQAGTAPTAIGLSQLRVQTKTWAFVMGITFVSLLGVITLKVAGFRRRKCEELQELRGT